MSRFVPGDVPGVTDDDWLTGTRAHFSGDVVVGKDLWRSEFQPVY